MLKNNMNTIFRGSSLIIKSGLTFGLFVMVGMFLVLSIPFFAEDGFLQLICGLPLVAIAFIIGIIGLIAGVWTLQDLIGWTNK